jgi:hypothetical protein
MGLSQKCRSGACGKSMGRQKRREFSKSFPHFVEKYVEKFRRSGWESGKLQCRQGKNFPHTPVDKLGKTEKKRGYGLLKIPRKPSKSEKKQGEATT